MLLAPEEPSPFEIVEGHADSPYLITVDHAGRLIPECLENLGVDEIDLGRHIAWDIGAAALGRALAERLGAWTILQTYSRLVIDCNRPLDSESLFVTRSEDTDVPGNVGLTEDERAARIEHIFRPYHERIEQELARRDSAEQPSVVVLLHSFTPKFREDVRKWHGGVLYGRDARLAHPLLELLRAEEDLVIGDNEPYAVSDTSDYGAIVYGERAGRLHVELEVRQDLLESESGVAEWAERLARLLPLAIERARG